MPSRGRTDSATARSAARAATPTAGCANSPGNPSRAPCRPPVARSTAEPAAFTAASAATVVPSSRTALAVPIPPLRPPTRAPVPAPTTPCATGPSAAASTAAAPVAAVGRSAGSLAGPPRPRSNSTAAGTIGTTAPGTGKPTPAAASRAITPSAAARPKALPPLRTTACTRWTVLRGIEQVGLPGARRGAADVHPGDRALGRGEDDGGARQRAGHARVPDPQAGDVGQGVVRSGAHAAIVRPGRVPPAVPTRSAPPAAAGSAAPPAARSRPPPTTGTRRWSTGAPAWSSRSIASTSLRTWARTPPCRRRSPRSARWRPASSWPGRGAMAVAAAPRRPPPASSRRSRGSPRPAEVAGAPAAPYPRRAPPPPTCPAAEVPALRRGGRRHVRGGRLRLGGARCRRAVRRRPAFRYRVRDRLRAARRGRRAPGRPGRARSGCRRSPRRPRSPTPRPAPPPRRPAPASRHARRELADDLVGDVGDHAAAELRGPPGDLHVGDHRDRASCPARPRSCDAVDGGLAVPLPRESRPLASMTTAVGGVVALDVDALALVGQRDRAELDLDRAGERVALVRR